MNNQNNEFVKPEKREVLKGKIFYYGNNLEPVKILGEYGLNMEFLNVEFIETGKKDQIDFNDIYKRE